MQLRTTNQHHQAFVPMSTSFYNKLLADEHTEVGNTAWGEVSIDQLIDQLINDLDDLLNTRQPCLTEGNRGLDNSVLGYGMCDLSTFNPESAADQQELCQYVQKLIANFEPRLSHVKVVIADADKFSFNFKLIITATYRLETLCLDIAFNSVFQPQDVQFNIDGVRYD